MIVSVGTAELARFVSAPQEDPYLSECVTEATELVGKLAGDRLPTIPGPVADRAILEVAADLYHRRATRNGIAGFDDTEISAAPVRINRDPLTPARPILAPWIGVTFG